MPRKNSKKNSDAAEGEAPGIEHILWEPVIDDEAEFQEEETEEEQDLSRRYVNRTALILLITVVMFIACILLYFLRDVFRLDSFSTEKTAVAKEEYVFDAGAGQVFATAGHGLASATTSGFMLMDENGKIAVSHLFQMPTPAITACEDFAVYYDLGGTNMAVAFFDGTVSAITPAGKITSVTVSSGGYIAVVTDCTGYRALVTVYDSGLDPVYECYSSSAWVLSAQVSPDNKSLAVLCYTASGSEVRFYNLSKTDLQSSFSVTNTVLLDLHWFSSSQLCAYSTEWVYFFNTKGECVNAYSFENRFLTDCTFDGESYAVFALSTYRSATSSTLVSLDSGGKLLGTTDIQGEIVSLTASSTEVLVLLPDSAMLCGSTLSLKGRLSGLTGFKYGLLRSRGEALLISANYAEVYSF